MAATISRQAQNSNTFAYLPFQEPSCPVRQLYVPANSIHDFHPSIAPSGLYWVVSVPERDLTISPDENTFTLEMQNVTVVDQPRWPAQDSIATPARMSFKMVWKSTGECVEVRLCHYRGRSQRSLRRQLFVRLVLRYKI